MTIESIEQDEVDVDVPLTTKERRALWVYVVCTGILAALVIIPILV